MSELQMSITRTTWEQGINTKDSRFECVSIAGDRIHIWYYAKTIKQAWDWWEKKNAKYPNGRKEDFAKHGCKCGVRKVNIRWEKSPVQER